ncbi:MAG: hypothetical protein JSW05_02800 [Candidatus Thorarchaeota archaeon]|nr:MAG: hypothetical protein JSW05_02800 [Candidatus Thorarchaeota archaeon]
MRDRSAFPDATREHFTWLLAWPSLKKMAWCVMVKGPCRGRFCDFWARVRLRKIDHDRLLEEMRVRISASRDDGQDIEIAIQDFWKQFGLRDLGTICSEEPDLRAKIRLIEEEARDMVS